MEIKRKFDLLVATNRRYTIRQSPSVRQIDCAECGEAMLMTEQAADFFGIKQRRIFQIIETKAVHFSRNRNWSDDDLFYITGGVFAKQSKSR